MTEHEFRHGYEDDYGGLEFDTGAELVADLEAWSAPGNFAWELNVPIWVDVPDKMAGPDCEYCVEYGERVECSHRLKVGIMLTRKGRTTIKYTDHFTDEDVTAIRSLMMRVWAMRADAGFARHYFTREPIEA